MKAIHWEDTWGTVAVNHRLWWDSFAKPIWIDGALVAPISLDLVGVMRVEFVMTMVQRHYLLGVTALTWPTHENEMHDSGSNEDVGMTGAWQSYEERCYPMPPPHVLEGIIDGTYSQYFGAPRI